MRSFRFLAFLSLIGFLAVGVWAGAYVLPVAFSASPSARSVTAMLAFAVGATLLAFLVARIAIRLVPWGRISNEKFEFLFSLVFLALFALYGLQKIGITAEDSTLALVSTVALIGIIALWTIAGSLALLASPWMWRRMRVLRRIAEDSAVLAVLAELHRLGGVATEEELLSRFENVEKSDGLALLEFLERRGEVKRSSGRVEMMKSKFSLVS
ncbi:MAG: hypothetical protein K8W52_24315 [Deltaproteobacteria bacterium]|nr:hypothetical protein [Deltaproteobacteria bacterium]